MRALQGTDNAAARRPGPQTSTIYFKWVLKFNPGFNALVPLLAGAMGTGNRKFLIFAVIGAMLWSGAGIVIGAIFHAGVNRVPDILSTMDGTVLLVLGILLTLSCRSSRTLDGRFALEVASAEMNWSRY